MVYKNLIYNASPTFQSNKEPQDAGDYILNKANTVTFCNSTCPTSRLIGSTYQNFYNFRTFTLLKKQAPLPTFNKTDLNINLFTKMDLEGVTVINDKGIIDPSGVLFGNTECGINNFENFLVPYVCPISNS